MNVDTLSRRWFLCAISYFVAGISLGVYMGASQDHTLYPVHAHINLLGWASMALTGLLYRVFPAAAQSALARWHFWLFQAGVPVLLAAVTAIHLGHKEYGPAAGVSSIAVLVSVLLFWWAIFSARSSKMS
jgi:hypothetical protein